MITVRFEKVGRNKNTWDALISEWGGQEIIQELRKAHVLDSSPDLWYNNQEGKIYFDGYQLVGTFRLLN